MSSERRYDPEPANKNAYTRSFDRSYTRFARLYDVGVRYLPVWHTWLRSALPHIRGPRVLEVSFGTGYLLSRYARLYETYGVDYNAAMARTARQNLQRAGLHAGLCRGRVEALPYRGDSFDTVLNTMAFSGYPDAIAAMAEMKRVLKSGGRLLLIDINHPAYDNPMGRQVVKLARRSGDLIRDLDRLLTDFGFAHRDVPVGGGPQMDRVGRLRARMTAAFAYANECGGRERHAERAAATSSASTRQDDGRAALGRCAASGASSMPTICTPS